MAISVTCQCGKKLTLKDELAGKAIRCPACKQPLRVPASGASGASQQQAAPVPTQPAAPAGALSDMFDQEGFKQMQGPACPACAAEMKPGTFICMKCGYNAQTGEKLQGHEEAAAAASEFGNEKLDEAAAFIKRDAEVQKSISGAGMPWWALASIILMVVGLAVVGVLVSNSLSADEDAPDAQGSSIPSTTLLIVVGTISAFWLLYHVLFIIFVFKKEEKPTMGLLCAFIPFFPLVYGFMNFRDKLLQKIFKPWMALAFFAVASYFVFLGFFRLLGVG